MAISVGIDLGTTFSAVAIIDPDTGLPKIVPNSDGKNSTPSIIQFLNGKPVFGMEAERAFNAGVSGCVATFKRGMGKRDEKTGKFKTYCTIDGVPYTSEKLSELLLSHLKKETEAVLGDTIDGAVITVPAYFDDDERKATIRAAVAAGIWKTENDAKLIDEPNAAVMAYGLKNWRENANILVYDLGGGTFDVTLVNMGENGILRAITTKGDSVLGGRDWDNRIKEMLLDKFADEIMSDIRNDTGINIIINGLSENVKKQLSAAGMDTIKVKASLPGYGDTKVTVTRDEFEKRSVDLINRTGALCKAVLAKAREVLNDSSFNENNITDILLVGGSTRMPQVSKYLKELFGKEPIKHINPDEAVALGAAIQATKQKKTYFGVTSIVNKDGKKVTDGNALGIRAIGPVQNKVKKYVDDIEIIPTTPHSMGIIAINTEGTHYINDIIIPVNHPYPVHLAKSFAFYTSSNSENEMDVYVLQGDSGVLISNIKRRYVISGIKHINEKRGETKINVQYSYNHNAIIEVKARQENYNVNLPIREEPIPEDVSKYNLPVEQTELKKHEPLSVVMAVDVSGSMGISNGKGGTALSDAQNAMCNFVHNLDFSNTKVGVVAVSDRSEIVINLSSDENACIRAIRSITCGQTGGGNAGHPFNTIKDMLKGNKGKLFAIILADGVWEHQGIAISASKDCNRANIETVAIGFGGADEDFLRNISSSDANAIYVSQSELSSAFGSIAQSIGGSGGKTGSDINASDVETWDN
jgi:molecular chaperone DnaK